MKIRPANLKLFRAYRRTSPEMTFTKIDDVIMHVQSRVTESSSSHITTSSTRHADNTN
jgi:hypothetical protein